MRVSGDLKTARFWAAIQQPGGVARLQSFRLIDRLSEYGRPVSHVECASALPA